ncbi:MAG: glucose-6-phosphate dehydrogenase [Acidobacteriota bacterium]
MTKRDIPFDMVVVGATGDLGRRKLLPALYFLHKYGEISPQGRIFAVSRREGDRDSFLAEADANAQRHIDASARTAKHWKSFAKRLDYLSMDATDADDYAELKSRLDQQPDRVRVFYLATSPRLYGPISHAIHAAGLVTKNSRIVLEKPIGTDLESATVINSSVGECFEEQQIFRIDHYLGKETVQNLMAVRFGNILFEPLWRTERIDHVQITVAETLGVEGRGAYYDTSGALRDMIQNHLLQLLCLTAMEPPARLQQDAIREEKIKVLRALRPFSLDDVSKRIVRGQYRSGAIAQNPVTGYLDEPDVPEDSTTETFVALKAEIDNWRWAGVPFYLRTGKRMGHRVSEIVIQFKQVPHQLFKSRAGDIQPNRLVIRLQPDEFIKLGLMTKVPGAAMVLERAELNLNLAARGGHKFQAYERLLLDVIQGVTTLFMHRTEVEAAWKWVEPILDGWKQLDSAPRSYGAGTWGPPKSVALIERDGRSWYEHIVDSGR